MIMAYFGWFVLLPALWGVLGYSVYAVLRDEGWLRPRYRRGREPGLSVGHRETGRPRRGRGTRSCW